MYKYAPYMNTLNMRQTNIHESVSIQRRRITSTRFPIIPITRSYGSLNLKYIRQSYGRLIFIMKSIHLEVWPLCWYGRNPGYTMIKGVFKSKTKHYNAKFINYFVFPFLIGVILFRSYANHLRSTAAVIATWNGGVYVQRISATNKE